MITESEYFDRIPIWNVKKRGKSFKVFKDLSPLPVTRLESWQDFQQFIKKRYDGELSKGLIFRGQRRYDWKLISTLGRGKNSNFFFGSEETQLKEFKKAIRGRIQDHSLLKEKLSKDEENELWSIGQHHGLMTPLLDWTHSPYVALFFAFIEEDTIEESLMPNYYRSVYIFDSLYFESFIKNPKVRIFKPNKDDHGRLVSQDGVFTISTLEIDIETEIYNSTHKYLDEDSKSTNSFDMAQHVCKIYIKNQDRKNCLQHLEHMNINHKSLFPDLHGSANFCNKQIASFGYNLQKARISKGSLVYVRVEENNKYEKFTLCEDIENILNEILNDSLSDDEKNKIKGIDKMTKENFEKKPIEGICLVLQIEILAGEIARQIQELKKLPIPFHSYESLMRAKIDLILRKFNFIYLEPIQDKKQQVIDEIMDIKEIQDMISNNKT